MDKTPPVTTIHGLPFGWQSDAGPVLISLSSIDTSTPPTTTFYRINGGAVTTYTASFAISDEGTTTIDYWAQDSAVDSNIEAVNRRFVFIDRTGPILPAGVVKPNYTSPASVSLGLLDAVSGVALASWRLDGAALSGVDATARSLLVSAPGVHSLAWVALDVAGNESTGTASFVVKRAQKLTRTPAKSSLTLRRVRGVATYRTTATVKATSETAPFTVSVPLAGKPVILQRSTDGKTWKTVKTRTTSATGVVSYNVRLTKAGKAQYRWYSPGDATLASGTSASSVVTVR